MALEEVYHEKRSDGKTNIYVRDIDNGTLSILKKNRSLQKTFLDKVQTFLREVFLPDGYPDSVSKDYWDYQLWDSIQAFFSTLMGTMTTQTILQSVGVGDAYRSSLSATITWIIKDGTGMIGRILFAWKEGKNLDADCKKWRFFADILNDIAMGIEFYVLPILPSFAPVILCLTTSMKGIVGVAGGASKASVTHHQAVHNNLGDVSAKDGSQETCLNLVGSIFGIFLLSLVSGNKQLEVLSFNICLIMHLYSNYRAIETLQLKTLNKERFLILLKTYFKYQTIGRILLTNYVESIFFGSGITDIQLCGFNIEIGYSLKKLIDEKLLSPEEFYFYSNREVLNNKYMLIVSKPTETIFVILNEKHTDKDTLLAYFHSLVLGTVCTISSGYTNKLEFISEIRKVIYVIDPMLNKLKSLIVEIIDKSLDFNLHRDVAEEVIKKYKIPYKEIIIVEEDIMTEFDLFFNRLKLYGWKTDTHQLPVGDWRAKWGSDIRFKMA